MIECPRCDSEYCTCGYLGELEQEQASRSALESEFEKASAERGTARAPSHSVAEPIPAPTNPMAVARHLSRDLYTNNGSQRLRNHRGDFHKWNGTCWPEAEGRGIRGEMYRYLEDATYEKVTKGEIEIVPWQPTRRKVDDVLDALKAITYLDGSIEPPAWLQGSSFDQPPATEIVSMANGLLHVPSRWLLGHTADYFCRHSLPYSYDSDAPLPERWLSFLKKLWPEDPDSIKTLQEIFGYIIGGGTEQQKLFLLVGPKRGGKGTIGRVLTGLLGKHNVAAPTLAGLATNFGIQPLVGRPLALISDARLSSKADAGIVVERLLSISGEDALTVDRKYQEPWTGRLPTRFLILTNELPRLSDSSGAVSSRFVMLVLTHSWYGQENPKLTDELLEEAPSILNWALEGLDRLVERGYFKLPAASAEAITQLEDLASPMAAFLRDICCLDAEASVEVEELWQAGKSWCEDQGRTTGTKAIFGRDLRAAAPLVSKVRPWKEQGSRPFEYAGIGLLKESQILRGHNNGESP